MSHPYDDWGERILKQKEQCMCMTLSGNQTLNRHWGCAQQVREQDEKGLVIIDKCLSYRKENMRKLNSDYCQEFRYYTWALSLML